jgi:hypothetical protein
LEAITYFFFSSFHHEDKVMFEGVGNDTPPLSESPIQVMDEPNSDEESDSSTIGRDKPRSLCG